MIGASPDNDLLTIRMSTRHLAALLLELYSYPFGHGDRPAAANALTIELMKLMDRTWPLWQEIVWPND